MSAKMSNVTVQDINGDKHEFEIADKHARNEIEKLKKEIENTDDIEVVDIVEPRNTNAVQSGAVYNHVAVQVGNIEILLSTI